MHCSVLGEGGDDVRIAGVGDGQGADAEQLAACGAECHIVALEVLNKSLGEESVVLDLALAAARVSRLVILALCAAVATTPKRTGAGACCWRGG